MSFVLQTLAHTPAFVFVLLAALVWQGVRALGTRAQPLWSLLIAPGAFAVVGLVLLSRTGRDPIALAAWLAGALAGAPLGIASAPRLLAVDPQARVVTRAGSAVPLLRNLIVFGLQYAVAVAQALHPEQHGLMMLAASAVSGSSVGYGIGWAVGFRSRYRAAATDGRAGPCGLSPAPTHAPQSVITSAQ